MDGLKPFRAYGPYLETGLIRKRWKNIPNPSCAHALTTSLL